MAIFKRKKYNERGTDTIHVYGKYHADVVVKNDQKFETKDPKVIKSLRDNSNFVELTKKKNKKGNTQVKTSYDTQRGPDASQE